MRKQLLGVAVAVFVAAVGLSVNPQAVRGLTCDEYASIANDTEAYIESHPYLGENELEHWHQVIQHAVDKWWSQGCNANG